MSKDYIVVFGAGVPVAKIKEVINGLELASGSFTVKCEPEDFATPETSVAPVIEGEKKKRKTYKKNKPYYRSSSENIINILLEREEKGWLSTAYIVYEIGKSKGLEMPAIRDISWSFNYWNKRGYLKKHYRGTYSLTPAGLEHFHGCGK